MTMNRLLLLSLFAIPVWGADANLRAGAARVDITPLPDAALPMAGYGGRTQGFKGIHDHIYVRAVVLDNGTTQTALVAWELLFAPVEVWSEVSRRVNAESGIRPENLLLAAVHDHDAPTIGAGSGPTAEYTRKVEDAAVEAVRLAKQKLQPAKFGAGFGSAYVNVNRHELTPDRGWWLGYNENGASDKTVSVLRFDDLSGKPIAFFINYPVHAVVMGPENMQVSGDLAGATSRFVERHYLGEDRPRSDSGHRMRLRPGEKAGDEGVVAIWTSGAAGDQNPVSMSNGEDFTMVDALGKILGEEVVRVANSIRTSPEVRMSGAQQVVTCPGRTVEAGTRPRTEYKFADSNPVEIRLSLLMFDNLALAGVSGEVMTGIYQHLRKESPFRQTIMVTHANGSSGYISDNAGFDQPGYEVTTSHLKPGCAEDAIVNGLVNLMKR